MLMKLVGGTKRRMRRRRAAVAVLVVVMIPVLLGFAAITVDVGAMYNARNDLQRAADAAALAAVGVIASTDIGTDPFPGAIAAAVEYAGRNEVMGEPVIIDPGTDIVFGHAVLDAVTKEYTFVAGEAPQNAVRITVRRTEDSPNGSLPLYFAGIFGKSATNVSAHAAAMYLDTQYEEADCWDVVPEGSILVCMHGDPDDSDDSASGDSVDSDDSEHADSGSDSSSDSGGGGDSDDSDDSASGDSVDSDDSHDSGANDSSDSESHFSGDSADSDGGTTVMIDENAADHFFDKGATLGPCVCPQGDPDDSDDSEAGDSSDSDDSDGNGPGSVGGLETITVCHISGGDLDNGKRLTIGVSSLGAHLAHGDVIGACTGTDGSGGFGTGNNGGKLRVVLIE